MCSHLRCQARRRQLCVHGDQTQRTRLLGLPGSWCLWSYSLAGESGRVWGDEELGLGLVPVRGPWLS